MTVPVTTTAADAAVSMAGLMTLAVGVVLFGELTVPPVVVITSRAWEIL
jgi:hypothetical protein